MDFFPENYRTAHLRFISARPELNRFTASHLMAGRGAEGEELVCYLRVIGEPEAKTALLLLSGTHGAEGFWGTASQLLFLEEFADKLGPHIKVGLIHALNPWGYSYLHRNTEDNIDLNRAFYLGEGLLNPHFAPFSHLFGTGVANSDTLIQQTWDTAAQHGGRGAIKAALFDGQTENSHAPGFGGNKPPQIHAALKKWIPEHFYKRAKLVVIDFHTGLGDPGGLQLMSQHPPGTNADYCSQVFANVESTNKGAGNENGSGLRTAIVRLSESERSAAVVAELGTLPSPAPGRAILKRVWLHENHATPQGRIEHAQIISDMKNAFDPSSTTWRREAIATARSLLGATLRQI